VLSGHGTRRAPGPRWQPRPFPSYKFKVYRRRLGSRIPIAAEAAPATGTGLASGQRQLTRLRLPVGASGCRAAAPTPSRSGMFNKCHQNFGNFKPKTPCFWCAIERAFCANFALGTRKHDPCIMILQEAPFGPPGARPLMYPPRERLDGSRHLSAVVGFIRV
jgi:hypothetical protein